MPNQDDATCAFSECPPHLLAHLRSVGYTLTSILGSGGYGTVYLASQQTTGRQVALKLVDLAGDARRLARFQRETALCASLHHPHIVQLLDKGEVDSQVYGVFEYVPGETLKNHVQRQGPMSAVETGRIMLQVLDAIDCAHQAGIVHRDLKPDNVMITSTGTVVHAKVLDFGISTVMPHARDESYIDLTMTQECLGTPAYCAPEQLRGEPPTAKSDLYAWGLMFVECLTGKPVMNGPSAAEIYHQQLSANEVSLPTEILNHPLAAVLRRALKKNPSDRCATARALLQYMHQIRLDDLVGKVRGTTDFNEEHHLAHTVASKRAFSEKRTLTVLSCSVTVWPQAHGADMEELECLQRQTFDSFVDVATRRGGLLVGRLGDRMLVLFGYPHASDTDARRAGMSAEDIMSLNCLQSNELARLHGVQLVVRGGLHTGMVIMSGGEAPSGHTVNLAMQLERAATAGEMLVSEEGKQALGRVGSFQLSPRTVLKHHLMPGRMVYGMQPPGKERTRWMDDTGSDWRPPLGRNDELQTLQAIWGQAGRGWGKAALLKGEAGMGKSCLVNFMAHEAEASGARVLHCQCLPEYQNNALAPVLAVLKQAIAWAGQLGTEDAARARLHTALEKAGCDTAQLMPIACSWLGLPIGMQAPSQISPSMQKGLFLQALVQWLVYLASNQATLIVLEDLHWADSTTLEWLGQFSATWPASRVLVLMTARPSYTPPEDWPLQTLTVGRIPDEQAKELVKQLLAPTPVDKAVIDNVVARTDGVPLFVQELTRMLRDSQLDQVDGTWHFKMAVNAALIPVSLQDSLISRFDQLGVGKSLLQLAAVIGRQFDLRLLAACADIAPDELQRAVARLQEARLIRAVKSDRDALEFRHALIRDAAYDCMLAERASEQHGRVAQELLALYPERVAETPDSVATHCAKAGDYEQAVAFGLKQLRITQHRSLHDDTIVYAAQVSTWIDRSLDAPSTTGSRLDLNSYMTHALMNKYGWAHEQVKDVIAQTQALVSDPSVKDKQVPHLWSMIMYHHVASNRAEVRQLSQRLSDLAHEVGDDSVQAAAHMYLGLAHYSDGQFEHAETMLSMAINGYQPQVHGHHAATFGYDTRVWATAGRALVRRFAGQDTAAEEDAEQAVAWARAIDHVPSLCMALLYQALCVQARGDRDAVLAVITELLSYTHRYGLPAFEGYAETIRCWAVGEVATADTALAGLWQMGCRYCQTYYRSFAAQTLADQGQFEQALVRLDECLAMVEQLNEHMYTAELHLQRAHCLIRNNAESTVIDDALKQACDISHFSGKHRTEAQARALMKDRAARRDAAEFTPSESGRKAA